MSQNQNQVQISVSNAVMGSIFNAKGKIFLGNVPQFTQWGENKKRVFDLALSMEGFGFTLSPMLAITLSNLERDVFVRVGTVVLDIVKTSVGGHRAFQPMYPNFPKQVLEMSDYELHLNAFMHYLGDWMGVRILPKYEESHRKVLEKFPKPKVVDLCLLEEAMQYLGNMSESKVSYSVSQKEEITQLLTFIDTQGLLGSLLEGKNISNKENLAYWSNLYLKLTSLEDFKKDMLPRFATATDVLRFVAGYCGGDLSLAVHFKVAKLPRSIRKLIAGMLEQVYVSASDKEQVLENLLTYRSLWVRVAHAMHIGEYQGTYPHAAEILNKLRNKEDIQTFNGKLEYAYASNDVLTIVELLVQRPGVFARNLSRLLVVEKPFVEKETKGYKSNRKSSYSNNAFKNLNHMAESMGVVWAEKPAVVPSEFSKQDHLFVLEAFASVAKNVSTPVLMQLHSHYKNIEKKMSMNFRMITPKGGLSKTYLQNGVMPRVNLLVAARLVEIVEAVLIARFAKMPSLGNVYIADELKNQNVPFAMRSASKALKTVARGSRFPLKGDKKLRFFLWWTEGDERVDIDLTVSILDKNFKVISHCSYWNLRELGMVHSGDITSAPNGACEFIDVDRSKLQSDARYLAFTLTAYTGQKYCDLPECFAGWMETDDLNVGKVFDARLVKNKIDLSSDTTEVMPVAIDLVDNQVLWVDSSYGRGAIASNNARQAGGVENVVKGWATSIKPNLYDLFEMHAKARGTLVEKAEDADVIFSNHEGVTPYDFDVITSEYMADAE